MTLAIDCTSSIQPAAIINSGYSHIFRYLSHSTWKNLTKAEADRYVAGGVGLVLNWESTGTLGSGYAQGRQDALDADAQATAFGYPGHVIYFSVDYDCTDWDLITSYFTGVASVIGPARVGAYGGYWVIDHIHKNGLAAYLWQTLGWSTVNGVSHSRHPAANVIQRIGTVSVGGVDCDVNDVYSPDIGQIGLPAPVVATPTKGLPEMIDRPLVEGNNTGTIICPTGSASRIVAEAWVSVRCSGGADVSLWFQRSADSDDAAPGAGEPVAWTLKSATRAFHELPSGTEFIEYDVDALGPGAICVELMPA